MGERVDGRYYRISPRFWQKRDVRSRWTEDMRLLALYLLTSPHRNMVGLYYCPKYYMAADLQWDTERLESALGSLLASHFVVYDQDAEIVFVRNSLKYDSPTAGNQVLGAIKSLKTLPNTPLLLQLVEAAHTHCKPLAAQLESTFADTLAALRKQASGDSRVTTQDTSESLGKGVGSTVSVSVPVTVPVAVAVRSDHNDNDFASLVDFWHRNAFGTIGTITAEKIGSYLDDGMPADLIQWAMEEAVVSGTSCRNWKYVSSILERLQRDGITSREQAEAQEAARQVASGVDKPYRPREVLR